MPEAVNDAYQVNQNFVKVGGLIYPVTHSFVTREHGMPGTQKALFPVTSKYVIKRHSDAVHEELEQYTGLIYEFYNMMPWVSESYGRSTSMWIRMACSFINFSSVSYNFGGGYSHTEQDEFGLTFARVNCEGENSVHGGDKSGWTLEQIHNYEKAHGGGKGVVISAGSPYRYGGWTAWDGEFQNANQPVTSVGSECTFVSLSSSDSTSGSDSTSEFGWLGGIFRGDCISTSDRERDMVMWFYDLAYDTGYWQYELDTEGIPSNTLFAPGQVGWCTISNEYKYAPWERYQHLENNENHLMAVKDSYLLSFLFCKV